MKKIIFILFFILSICLVSASIININEIQLKLNITKTEDETLLNINYKFIDKNNLKICIESKEFDLYTDKKHSKKQDFKEIPIIDLTKEKELKMNKNKVKLKSNSFLRKTMDFITGNEDECFNVNFKEYKNIKLKIGWASVVIDGIADQRPTFSGNANHILQDIYGYYHVTYDTPNGIGYCNNTNNDTWSCKQLGTETYDLEPNIMMDNNNNLFIVFIKGSSPSLLNLSIYNSTDYGATWSNAQNLIPTVINSFYYYHSGTTCEIDSNNIIHCIFYKPDSIMNYVNSSNWSNWVDLNTGIDDVDGADITIDENNKIYIVGSGSDQDDLDLWTFENGIFSGSKIKIDDILYGSEGRPDIVINNGNITICYADNKKPSIINGSTDNLNSWTITQVSTVDHVGGCTIVRNSTGMFWAGWNTIVNSYGNSFHLYNFTNVDEGFTLNDTLTDVSYVSALGTLYPESNHADKTGEFIMGVYNGSYDSLQLFTLGSGVEIDTEPPIFISYKSLDVIPYDITNPFYVGDKQKPTLNVTCDESVTCYSSQDNSTWTEATIKEKVTNTFTIGSNIDYEYTNIYLKCLDNTNNVNYTNITLYQSYMMGTVKDSSNNLIEDSIIQISLNNSESTTLKYVVTTNSTGDFKLPVSNGIYTICAYDPNQLLRGDCTPHVVVPYG